MEFDIVPTDFIVDWIVSREDNGDIYHEMGPLFIVIILGLALTIIMVLLYCFKNFSETIDFVYTSISQ
jgi:hypothetical protein